MQLVSALTSILIGVLVSRTLGPEGKGMLAIIQQVVGVLLVFGDLGIGLAAVYYISKGEVRAGTVLGNAAVAVMAVGAIGFGAVWLLFRTPLAVQPLTWAYTLAAFAMFLVGLALTWLGSIAVGLHGVKGSARASMLAASVTLLVVLSAWIFGLRTPLVVILASVAGSLAGIALAYGSVRREVHPVRASLSVFLRMTRYSLRLYVGSAADFLHFRQDILMLGWLSSVSSAGIYSVGVSVAELASRLPSAIGSAIQAKASRVSHQSALEFSARAIRLTVLFSAVVVGALAVVSGLLIPWLFGEAFRGAVSVFYLLAPGILANALIWPISSYQSARGQVYWGVSVVSVVLNVALNVVLISLWDYRGAALSSSISYVVLLGGLLVRLRRDTRLPLSAFLVPTGEDVRIAVSSLRSYLARG
jgi:O-antigen/teichoic acid export membrane protein